MSHHVFLFKIPFISCLYRLCAFGFLGSTLLLSGGTKGHAEDKDTGASSVNFLDRSAVAINRQCENFSEIAKLSVADYQENLRHAIKAMRAPDTLKNRENADQLLALKAKIKRIKYKLNQGQMSAEEAEILKSQLILLGRQLVEQKKLLTKEEQLQFDFVMNHLQANQDVILDQGVLFHRLALAPFGINDCKTGMTGAGPGGSKFTCLPSGSFIMGSLSNHTSDSAHEHKVTLTQSMEMSTTEVTREQWFSVMGMPLELADKNLPVQVSWDEIESYLKYLNSQDSNFTYRLPTEAEWEYAAKTGDNGAALETTGWCHEGSEAKLHGVATKPNANSWGLYDMYGNASEWTSDWYAPYYDADTPAYDPAGIDFGASRVIRGGSVTSESQEECTASFRATLEPTATNKSGFRVVRTRRH
jgi:hypothetical protein